MFQNKKPEFRVDIFNGAKMTHARDINTHSILTSLGPVTPLQQSGQPFKLSFKVICCY